MFQQKSVQANNWMKQWIRNAALKSPLTVKTSIWRLKHFIFNEIESEKSIDTK